MMNKLMLLTAISLGSLNAFAETTLSAQVQCYKSLVGTSIGANYELGNGSILLPGDDGGKKGFYVYSEKIIHFCEFPSRPSSKNSQFDHYELKLNLGDKGSVNLTYADNRQNRTNPGVSVSADGASSTTKFEPANCRAKLTDETRALLTEDLKARVASVYSTYVSHRDLMKQRFDRDEDPKTYTKSLEACSSIAELSAVTSKERAKFPGSVPSNALPPIGTGK